MAVRRFLSGGIRFTDIPELISHCLDRMPQRNAVSLEMLEGCDTETRKLAEGWSPRH